MSGYASESGTSAAILMFSDVFFYSVRVRVERVYILF